jgi:uncharacterized DUF497 family protein
MFSWDAHKALKNYEKHGVPFEEASTVFRDPDGLDWEDWEHVDMERRWKGSASPQRVALSWSYTPYGG